MININEDWAFKIDTCNNHMPLRWTEVKPRDKPAYWEWKHTGVYFPNPKQVLGYIMEVQLQEDQNRVDSTIEEWFNKFSKQIDRLEEYIHG